MYENFYDKFQIAIVLTFYECIKTVFYKNWFFSSYPNFSKNLSTHGIPLYANGPVRVPWMESSLYIELKIINDVKNHHVDLKL